MADLPIACTLNRGDRRARREELLPALLRIAEHGEPIADGHRYRFSATSATLQTIARVIDAERQCCPFFRFRLLVEPGRGPFYLEVTGPPGARNFLADLLAE